MRGSDPVNRVMSERVRTIEPTDSVAEMLRTFASYPIHHLPVTEDRRVVGMLSSADVLKLEYFLPPSGPARDAFLMNRFEVRRLMRTPVVTIAERETIDRAASIMAEHGFHALPVVDVHDHLVGIVTTTDLIRGVLRNAEAHSSNRPDHARAMDARKSNALEHARDMAARNDDPHGIASALLDAHARLGALELALFAAKRYMNAGQDVRLHALLQKAIERVDRLESESGRPELIGLEADE